MTVEDFPVFVVGAPRSGTTLLYSILLASGAFPIYEAESRVLECSSRYGTLRREANFRRFIEDFQRSRQFARSGLEPQSFREAALRSCSSYEEFLSFFMSRIARSQGKTRWAEKTPNHLAYVPELAHAFPESRFIHIVRDGRDVALSQRSVGMTARYSDDPLLQLVWGAKVWESLVRLGRRRARGLGARRYLELRFERVVSDLDGTIEKLNAFAGVGIDRRKVETVRVGALKRANTAFEADGIEGRVSERPRERWRSELTPAEVDSLHRVIGRTLRAFGYRVPDGDRRGVPPRVIAHGALAAVAVPGKRWMNRYTPLGRLATKPLEIGLS